MRRFFLTDSPQPEQTYSAVIIYLIGIGLAKTIQGNSIRDHGGQRVKINKTSCLRLRNTIETHVGWNVIKTSCRIKAAWQMQRRKYRRIDFSGPLPETSRHVMDQVEGLALTGLPTHKFHHPVF